MKDNIFGVRLRELRNGRKMSQKELAEQFKYTKDAVSKWEQGTRNPSLDDLVMVAKFFDVTSDFLIGLQDF